MKKFMLLGIVFLFMACPPTTKNAARIYIQQGDYQAAKAQILDGIKKTPNDFEYYCLLAKAEIGLGNWQAVNDAFMQGLAVDSAKSVNWLLADKQNVPVYWQALYNAAVTFMGDKKYDDALKSLRYCEILDPENVSEYILEGGIYSELGQQDKANAVHAKALSIDPENPEAYFLVGKAFFEKVQYDSALVNFNQAAKYFEGRYERAAKLLFQNLPEVDEALAKQIRMLWVDKKEAELDELVKVRLGFDGGLNTQRRTIEQFQKMAEGLARTYYYVGMAYYNEKKDSLALMNLSKSLDYNSNDIDALYYAGEICLRDDKYDEAINYFTKITQIKEDDVFAWFYLGVCYSQKKEYQKAVDVYENKVLILDPKNTDAMTNLAYVYRELGNNKKALEWLTKAEKLLKEQ